MANRYRGPYGDAYGEPYDGGIDEEDDPFADVQFSRTVRTPVTTGSPQTIIGDLNATIQRQGDKIDRLEVRVEALTDQLSQIVEFLNGR